MIYLASPYSPVAPEGVVLTDEEKTKIRGSRYRHTLLVQAKLFNMGYPVFCTIVHTHVTAFCYKLPTDAAFWMNFNHHMIDLSTAVFVLKLEGWQESLGVRDEIEYAQAHAIPVVDIEAEVQGNSLALNIPVIVDYLGRPNRKNPLRLSPDISTLPVQSVTISPLA